MATSITRPAGMTPATADSKGDWGVCDYGKYSC